MKTKVSKQLLLHLECAAKNGDRVAQFIVAALSSGRSHGSNFKGPSNNFRLVLNGLAEPKIRYTPVDPNHPEIEKRIKEDPYYLFDRDSECTPAKFAGMFIDAPKDLLMNNRVMENFASALAVGEVLQVKLSGEESSFVEAYDEENYASVASDDDSLNTLAHSCMRHDNLAATAAQFYSKVCRANILVVKAAGGVVGRAIVYPQVTLLFGRETELRGSLMSRVYYATPYIREFMFQWAKAAGINFRLSEQTLHCSGVHVMNAPEGDEHQGVDLMGINCVIPLYNAEYCGGGPYVDFAQIIALDRQTGKLVLVKYENDRYDWLGIADNTDGTLDINARVCPFCGSTDSSCDCQVDMDDNEDEYPYQNMVEVDGELVPAACVDSDGGLTQYAQSYLMLRRMW